MAGFRIDYQHVIRQASTIDDLADDLFRIIGQLEGTSSSVSGNWEGPASQVFQHRLTALLANMRETGTEMSRVSQSISHIATTIKREDDRQADLAKKLPTTTR